MDAEKVIEQEFKKYGFNPIPRETRSWRKLLPEKQVRDKDVYAYIISWSDKYLYDIEIDMFFVRQYSVGNDMMENRKQLLFKGYIKSRADVKRILRMTGIL